jgi:hypothetical protein
MHTGHSVPGNGKKPLEVPAGMVTRIDVQRILGVSRTMTRKLEEGGKLMATIDANGLHLFLRSDVIELARIRGRGVVGRAAESPKVAQMLFDMFERGLELPQIVMESGQSPVTVRAMYEQYRTPLRRKRSPLSDDSAAGELKDAAQQFQQMLTRLSGER